MFSTFNHFQMLKPGSVNGRCGALQIQMTTNQKYQNSIKLYQTALTGNGTRRHCAHQKHAKQLNEYY